MERQVRRKGFCSHGTNSAPRRDRHDEKTRGARDRNDGKEKRKGILPYDLERLGRRQDLEQHGKPGRSQRADYRRLRPAVTNSSRLPQQFTQSAQIAIRTRNAWRLSKRGIAMKENFDRLRAVSGVLVVIVLTCAVACQQRSASTSGKIRPIRLTTSVPLSYAKFVDHVAPAVVAG